MDTHSVSLEQMHNTLGYVPHPESLRDNPARLVDVARCFNVGALDIHGTDIGWDEGDEFISCADAQSQEDIDAFGYDIQPCFYIWTHSEGAEVSEGDW